MYFEAVSNEEGQSAGSLVLTDSRCNLHLTSSDCFERAVRLPAALKAAREAKGNICISTSVEDKYLELAEKNVILRAHKKSYIQKIKARCMSATGENVVPLTEDSEGNGGEDTSKSCCVLSRFLVRETLLTHSRVCRRVEGDMDSGCCSRGSSITGNGYDYDRKVHECVLSDTAAWSPCWA